MDNWFIYVWMGFFAFGVLELIAFLLPHPRSSSKFWLSLILDHFILKATLTPAEVPSRLTATINPFTPESAEPFYPVAGLFCGVSTRLAKQQAVAKEVRRCSFSS